MDTQDVGKLIKIKRKEKNMNQRQLAELLHVSYTTVSKWETGVNFPDIQNLKEISSVLDISLIELLDENSLIPGSESVPDTSDSPNEIDPTTPEPPIPDLQDEPTEPEVSPTCQPSIKKRKQLKMFLPLLTVLILVAGTVLGVIKIKENREFSVTIIDEYYGNYDYYGTNDAFYIIMEFTGNIHDVDLFKHAQSMIKEMESPVPDDILIILIYVKDYNAYLKNGFNDDTDTISVVFP